jgi:hypothetical protein
MVFYACECTNGTRISVNADASIVIPLPDQASPPPPRRPPPAARPPPVARPPPAAVVAAASPSPAAAASPPTSPAASPSPAAAPPAAGGPEAAALAADFPDACTVLKAPELLLEPTAKVSDCTRTPFTLGQRCWTTCRAALRALGYPCYAAAVAGAEGYGLAAAGANATTAYNQCLNNAPYSTAEEWEPVNFKPEQLLVAAAAAAPAPAEAEAEVEVEEVAAEVEAAASAAPCARAAALAALAALALL